METGLRYSALVLAAVLCWITVPFTTADPRLMGNITFECENGEWKLHGPDCYLLVDVALTLEDATEVCEAYGSDVVVIRDEVEAKTVGMMVQHNYPQWELYWIGNTQTDSEDLCKGFWDIGEPRNTTISSGSEVHVAANAPQGRWRGTEETTRLPVVCRTDACVEDTFRCRDGKKCISNNWKCDGAFDCEDQSDENDCAASLTYYRQGSQGPLIQNGYESGKTYSWFIEGTPGKPLSIVFNTLDVEMNVDYVEVWSGGPSVLTSELQERLTGTLSNKRVFGYNNFLIVRLITDLSIEGAGFSANWETDPELSMENREITADDSWMNLTSPYVYNIPPPLSYIRHYTVKTEDGSLITMEVFENDLGEGFEYDKMTLSSVTDDGLFPSTYVSRMDSFTFYLASYGCNGQEKFRGRVKKGCNVEVTGRNGFILPPNFEDKTYYPAFVTCSYIIRAPSDAERKFQLRFTYFNLADEKDTVKVYDGSDNSASQLHSYDGSGSNDAPDTTFSSTASVVLVEFKTGRAQSNGFFNLTYNLACPAITNTANMDVSSMDTQYETEVTLSCRTGYAFGQEEFVKEAEVIIHCGLEGKWNVSRLPTCQMIYCGVPESIDNGFISSGSGGGAAYNATVTYQCFTGFSLRGSAISTCGDGSLWSDRPTCEASQCESLEDIDQGNYTIVTGVGTNFGVVVNYTCNPGYDLVGSQYSYCQTNGNWSHAAPVCQSIKCPIPEIDMGTLSESDPVDLDSKLTVMCTEGYIIDGTTADRVKEYSCLATGLFEFDRDVCVDQNECPSACTGDHELCVNTEGSFRCDCEEKYKRNNGACEVIDRCAEDTSGCDLENGNCISFNSGEDYMCGCNPGYVLFTEDGLNGRYIPNIENGMTPGDLYYFNHSCVPVTCEAPPNITNGHALTKRTTFDFGDMVTYRCDFGYNLTNSPESAEVLTCNETGSWDKMPPTCNLLTCSPLIATGAVQNIYPNSTTEPEQMVTLECYSEMKDELYNKTLFCAYDSATDSFRLQGDSPDCPEIDCGEVGTISGAAFPEPSNRGLNSHFTFTCLDGFDRDGESTSGGSTVVCQRNGRWGLGNLTCTGTRCTDPGTPGGMMQTDANFEVNGMVVYNCTQGGFEPVPKNRTCFYNSTLNDTSWGGSTPVCKDVADPEFTNCPMETIQLKLYDVAGSEMEEPNAMDNSGLVKMRVSPGWFALDVPLAQGQLNVTYTAEDDAGNSAECHVTIEVNDPGQLPVFECPDYLTLDVNTTSSYTVTLSDHVTTDGNVELIYSEGPDVTVGPMTVGKTVHRVTATDTFGFQQQCAFIVDIRPNACLQTYIESGRQNAEVTCNGTGEGNLTCTVTCNDGFAFQDGETSTSYQCYGANMWSPALPVRSCVDTETAEYLFVMSVTYERQTVNPISECLDGLTAKLEETIPTQSVSGCTFIDPNEAEVPVEFAVSEVDYNQGSAFRMVDATVSLRVTSDISIIKEDEFEVCGLRLGSIDRVDNLFNGDNINCTVAIGSLDFSDPSVITRGKSCTSGLVLQTVGNVEKCVKCEPGYYHNGSACVECADGQYQDGAGETQCKNCENNAQHSTQPRVSSQQCVVSCPAGFSNSQSYTPSPDECIACPQDTYLSQPFTASCTPCGNDDTTSALEGADSADKCMPKCQLGQYPVNNTQCAPCPHGYYKTAAGNTACMACEGNQTTTSTGSSEESDCGDVTEATCENGGTPDADYHQAFCHCPEGYIGDTCQNSINACTSNPCYNGGECKPDGLSFTCTCRNSQSCTMVSNDITYDANAPNVKEFRDKDLEACKEACIQESDCAAIISAGLNCYLYNATGYTNNTRAPDTKTFIKSCAVIYYFDGDRCENDLVDDCTNETCGDISFCRDLIDNADCVCPSDSKYTQPKCDINLNLCTPGPCLNNGICVDSGEGVRTTCLCLPGYTGDNCEQNIPDCVEVSCLNGGSCQDEVDDYQCECGDYSGDYCQTKPDFCAEANSGCGEQMCYNDYNSSSAVCVCEFPYEMNSVGACVVIDKCEDSDPCQNNGTCTSSSGVASCQCPAGFTGSLCQHNIDDCASNPCENGRCVDLVTDYMCHCDNSGFEGKNCSIPIDECSSNNCTNTTTQSCEDLVNGFRCVCMVGFTGQYCESNINECLSLPCQHNATCAESVTPGDYTCSCVDEWRGKNCDSLGQFCSDDTCNDNGDCYSLQDDFFCSCDSGTFGETCSTTGNLCDTVDPCASPATCLGVGGTVKCQCPTNYTGSSCNVIEDTCSDMPCETDATCVTYDLGYTCQCKEGYSGENCTESTSVCESANCPPDSNCTVIDDEVICVCGAGKLRSGNTCKDVSSDFDIYFAKRDEAIRSYQPFSLSKENGLSVMFMMAALEDTYGYPVQLKLSNGTSVLAVNKENVTFGEDDPVRLAKGPDDPTEFTKGMWDILIVSWNSSGYDLYFSGIRLVGAVTNTSFPPIDEPIFLYIGDDFKGYISQVNVWHRRMDYSEALGLTADPNSVSSDDLLVRWSGFNLSNNLWSRILPYSSAEEGGAACENGQFGNDCNKNETDKKPPMVMNCPAVVNFNDTERLVQLDDKVPANIFDGGQSTVSNIDRKLLTFGAYQLVYMSADKENNVEFCRFSTYVQRQGQSCSNTKGLDETKLNDCGTEGKGRIVQCPSGELAPMSPRVLTCGKLGSYNLAETYKLPPAIICGATGAVKYKIAATLKYKLSLSCAGSYEDEISGAIKGKVQTLQNNWNGLCSSSSCDSVQATAKCQSSTSTNITVTLVLRALPAVLDHGTTSVTLTPKELMETATLEQDAFKIDNFYNAQLLKDEVVIEVEKSCDDGYGLFDDVCVECAQGSFLNEDTGMCQLCPIGKFTDNNGLTQCTMCASGETTLQEGSKECVEECPAGKYYDQENDSPRCKDCPKNFYQNETGQVLCLPCPSGKATETSGVDSLDLCYDVCDAGTELKNSTCVPCPRGTYRDGIGQEVCEDCESGKTTADKGTTSSTRCDQTACNPGYFRNTSNKCEECDYGFYQPEKWQDECEKCNDSYTTENKATTSAALCLFVCGAGNENLNGMSCTPCVEGFYRTDSLEDRFKNCTGCNGSFTTPTIGSTSPSNCSIRICNAGSFRNETDNECYDCPVGQYQNESLQMECKHCRENTTTRGEASTSETACEFYCPAGYEEHPSGSESCRPCQRGYFKTNDGDSKFGSCQRCTENTTNSEASTSADDCNVVICAAGEVITGNGCEGCPVDTYQEMDPPKLETTCQNCSTGQGTKAGNQTSSDKCEPFCAAGEQYNSTSSQCEPCPVGTYNTGSHTDRFEQCTPCQTGYVTANESTGATSNDSCTLRDCAAGEYIDGDDCSVCPVGQYQDRPRQTTCTDCPVNKNTSAVATKEERDQLSDCTISCPAGQQQVQGIDNCTLCEADTIKADSGPGQCQPCDGNYTANNERTRCDVLYCDKGFELKGGSCEACDTGEYKAERGNETMCISCSANKTTAGLASFSEEDCDVANCEQGFYSPDDSLPCLACPVGTYKNTIGNQNCTTCQGNFTTSGEGSTDSGQCDVVVCPKGEFRQSQSQCEKCSFGLFQNETGQTDCYTCPPGYNTTAVGADDKDDCRIVCPAGKYRDDSTNECKDCPVGKYQENSGQTDCEPCPNNYNTSATGSAHSTDCYIVCPAGEYNSSRIKCEPCDHGQYQPSTGSNLCELCVNGSTTLQTGSTSEEQCQPICDQGQYLNMTSRMCTDCPLGQYNPEAGTATTAVTICDTCPEGNTTSVTGAVSISQCNILDCNPGSYRSSSVGCEECPLGQYQPNKSQTSCLDCVDGFTTYKTGRINNASCAVECPSGQQYNFESNSCENCSLDYYRMASQTLNCIKCDPDKTTLSVGSEECVRRADGSQPKERKKRMISVVSVFLIGPCINREQIALIIIEAILKTFLSIDRRFPALCKNDCENVGITFLSGCLQDFTRRRRQTNSEQEVVLELGEVDNEITDNTNNRVQETEKVVRDAFYGIDQDQPVLADNGIRFVRLDNVSSSSECQQGQYNDGSDCKPCNAGTYSSDGDSCVSCLENTYQNNTGATSCLPCPPLSYIATTGSTSATACKTRCEETDADVTYCNGHGTCVFDESAAYGVQCRCNENYEGVDCSARKGKDSDRTAMIAGIAGGASAFLLILLLCFGIVACVRRSARKGKNGNGSSNGYKDKLYGQDDRLSEAYPDYNNPMYDNGMRGLSSRPAIMYMNPVAPDEDMRDFYAHDQSTVPSRQRSRSYESEWRDFPDLSL